jgi:hypothetical protein
VIPLKRLKEKCVCKIVINNLAWAFDRFIGMMNEWFDSLSRKGMIG